MHLDKRSLKVAIKKIKQWKNSRGYIFLYFPITRGLENPNDLDWELKFRDWKKEVGGELLVIS